MRAARWVVIGTALVAAATAFHLLLGPGGGTRTAGRPRDAFPGGPSQSAERAPGGSFSGGASGADSADGSGLEGRGAAGAPGAAGPPLDEIDAESREAMRNFLRESARDGK